MAKTSNLLACIALAIVLAAPRPADAGPKQEAKAHVDRATKAHRAGDLEKALKELQAAYGLDPQPQLLYALGQLYTKLGRCSEASDAYLRFLASGADAATAQVVKQAIDACKAPAPTEPAQDTEEPPLPPGKEPAKVDPPVAKTQPPPKKTQPPPKKTQPPPKKTVATIRAPEPEPPPPMSGTTKPWYRDVVGDVLVVGGVASLVLGGLAYRAARTDLDTAEEVSNHAQYEELVDGAKTKRLVGVALASGGAVFVTAGVLRFMLRDKRTEVRRVGVAPARGGGLLTWTRSF